MNAALILLLLMGPRRPTRPGWSTVTVTGPGTTASVSAPGTTVTVTQVTTEATIR